MAKLNTISFVDNDYLISGKPLLKHLETHENITASSYVPAFMGSSSLKHLLGTRTPDLELGKVALYLCSHCGGYDGWPIGVEITFEGDKVIWSKIGNYSDIPDETIPHLFKKVRKYVFEKQNYLDFLASAEIYESPYHG